MMFQNREHAGKALAKPLEKYRKKDKTIVLGLARGGVVVAYFLAKELNLPLNVIVPRKVGSPYNPELALGAILENGKGFFNESIIRSLQVPKEELEKEIERERIVAENRSKLYRKTSPLPNLKDYTVVLVDDGIATGATMLASIQGIREEKVKKIVVAVPVAAEDSLKKIKKIADEVVCLYSRQDFYSVSLYFHEFGQVNDDEVMELLHEEYK